MSQKAGGRKTRWSWNTGSTAFLNVIFILCCTCENPAFCFSVLSGTWYEVIVCYTGENPYLRYGSLPAKIKQEGESLTGGTSDLPHGSPPAKIKQEGESLTAGTSDLPHGSPPAEIKQPGEYTCKAAKSPHMCNSFTVFPQLWHNLVKIMEANTGNNVWEQNVA